MLINLFLWSLILFFLIIIIWSFNPRKYKSSSTVSSSYDAWTNDKLLEKLWGEHIHLGYYSQASKSKDFKQAKRIILLLERFMKKLLKMKEEVIT